MATIGENKVNSLGLMLHLTWYSPTFLVLLTFQSLEIDVTFVLFRFYSFIQGERIKYVYSN